MRIVIAFFLAGCSATTIPLSAAPAQAGRIGYGVQQHHIEGFLGATDIFATSLAAGAPELGGIGETLWQAWAGGRRLRFCTTTPMGLDCREATPSGGRGRWRGSIVIVDPINLDEHLTVQSQTDGSRRYVSGRGAVVVTDATYPLPPGHGIWVTDASHRSLHHCQVGDMGPMCNEATIAGQPIAPRVLGMFLLGQTQVLWAAHHGFVIVRCIVEPGGMPLCVPARG